MIRSIERVLNHRPGELGRGALLFAYLFLILTTYVVGKVVRDALFLARFKAVQLPYADIATAILVCFVVAGYVRIGRHASLHNLLAKSAIRPSMRRPALPNSIRRCVPASCPTCFLPCFFA